MFFLPLSIIVFILFVLLFPIFLIMLQFGIAGAVFSKLGLSPSMGILIYAISLIGSGINIPIVKKYNVISNNTDYFIRKYLGFPKSISYSVIAINVGGAIMPMLLSIYLFRFVPVWRIIVATGIITAIAYFIAKPVTGIGITLPALVPPIFSAIISLLLFPQNPAPLAYISGVIGTLIGADLLHLKDVTKMGVGVMSIGGAGVFDGIFLVGIIAVLLA
ncbi:DUF1614 domain-containing protein [candidate division WOR-3 bacterium]|nr:DUF1614 domain-containing protein [candidate division WOR-3 bacterium]